MEKFNKQRAQNREAPVDFNHPVICGMKGKSTWRIDAMIFVVICNFCGLIMRLKGLLIENMENVQPRFSGQTAKHPRN